MKKILALFSILVLVALGPVGLLGADKQVRLQSIGGSPIPVNYHDNSDGTYSLTTYVASQAVTVTSGTVSLSQTTTANDVDVLTLPATIEVKLAPTITADVYTAKDALGGEQTIAATVASGVIQSIVIGDLDAETPSLDIILFDTNPTTNVADNAPLDIEDADVPNIIGVVQFRSTDYTSLADNAVGFKGNLGIPFKCAAGTSLYAYIQYNDTDAFTATTDIKILISILPN